MSCRPADGFLTRGLSSVGRAPALQAGGQGFEPPSLHGTLPPGRVLCFNSYASLMRNRWILVGYALLFFVVVSNYDNFSDNTLFVVLATAVLTITGIGAWIWSVQPNKDKD